jgi:molybdopterin-guanine dinucleotide biosynthesis protein A
VTPHQMKAARTLLGWNRVLLAARSEISVSSVAIFEEFGRVVTTFGRTGRGNPLAAIRTALEQAGVEFTNGDAPNVRLRKLDL